VITSMTLKNFKCFKELSLELRSLNVFAGMNGAGKSTIIQSLLALRQSYETHNLQRGRIQLNGRLTELGTVRDVYCSDPTEDFIYLELCYSNSGKKIELSAKYSEVNADAYFLKVDKPWRSPGKSLDLFREPFNYLHAERIGPRKVLPIQPDDGQPYWVGKFGENASYIVASDQRKKRVDQIFLSLPSSDGKTYANLHYQWKLWMGRLFPGFDAEPEINRKADQVRLGLSLQQKSGRSLPVRPPNTGFGLSYVLGVIVAGLVATPESVLIVENPEAHLHPKAQSAMGEFLARVAATGAQVFVETHSEHVINGMRRMVKQIVLKPDNIRIHFFSSVKDKIEPSIKTVPVASNGDIGEWPDGFMDQLDKDLSILLD